MRICDICRKDPARPVELHVSNDSPETAISKHLVRAKTWDLCGPCERALIAGTWHYLDRKANPVEALPRKESA
jgi:hypothetical protein